MCGLLTERDDSLLAALAAHADGLLLEVDVTEVEPDGLGTAQAARVDELDERAIAKREGVLAAHRLHERIDLGGLRRLGQAARSPWRERPLGNAVASEREADEGAHGREPSRDRGRREAVAGSADLGRVPGERTHVDLLELDPFALEPARERAQVAAVGATCRVGEAGTREEAVDRGGGLHGSADFRPGAVLPASTIEPEGESSSTLGPR